MSTGAIANSRASETKRSTAVACKKDAKGTNGDRSTCPPERIHLQSDAFVFVFARITKSKSPVTLAQDHVKS